MRAASRAAGIALALTACLFGCRGGASGGRETSEDGGGGPSAAVDLPAFPVRVVAPPEPISFPMRRDSSGQLDVIEAPGPDGNVVTLVPETGSTVSIFSPAATRRYGAKRVGTASIALGLSDAQERRCDVCRIGKATLGEAQWEDWTVLSGVADIFAKTGADILLGADVLCGGSTFAWEPGAGRFWVARSLEAVEGKLGAAAARLPMVQSPTRKIFRPALRLAVAGAGEQVFMIDSASNKSLLVLPDEATLQKSIRRTIETGAGKAESLTLDGKVAIVPVHRVAVDLAAGEFGIPDVELYAYADARGHCGTINVVGKDAKDPPIFRQGVLGNAFLHRFSYVALDFGTNRVAFGAPKK